MLAIIEGFLADIGTARSDSDVVRLLKRIAEKFGFRSAYLMEYKGASMPSDYVLDSDPVRAEAWRQYFASSLHDQERMDAILIRPGLVVLDRDRLLELPLGVREFCERYDLTECVLVPVQHEGVPIGVIGFSGLGRLDQLNQMALHLVAYNLFATSRIFQRVAASSDAAKLTNREKQVLHFSADGKTSQRIAAILDISARTVNQYIDSAIQKLNASNRTQAVAEAIRRGIIDGSKALH